MAKKVLKRYAKDVGMLAFGGVALGASSAAISKMGIPTGTSTHIQSGFSTLGSGISVVAPLVGMKASVGLLGSTAKRFKPNKRRR